jgi:hypothetical protein
MGLIDKILAGGVNVALSAAGGLFKDIREAITGKAILDPNKQAELVLRAQEIENGLALASMAYDKAQLEGQLAINKAEAESPSLFKGGWRPAAGWTCVGGLLYTFLARPLLWWIIQVGLIIVGKVNVIPPLPAIEMTELLTLLGGLLGLGGMRMYEKAKGVASK